MLYKSQVNPGVAFASQLHARGFRMVAQPGTPLFDLVSTYMISQEDVIKSSSEGYKPDPNFITSSANAMDGHLTGIEVPHTTKLDALAVDIAVAVRGHLQFVKTVAVPVMREIAETYQASAERYKYDVGTQEIIQYDVPLPMKDYSMVELVEKFAAAPSTSPVPYIERPMSSNQFVEYCLAGVPGMEDTIRQWLAIKGDTFISMVMNACFSSTPDEPSNFEDLRLGMDGFDVSCLVFLATMGLYDNPPEGVRMSLSSYNTQIHSMRCRAADRLRYLCEEALAFSETKTLIISSGRDYVRVFSETHKEFIEGGGTNETIMAACRLRMRPTTLSEIANSLDQIQAEQRRFQVIELAAMENRRFAVLKDLLMDTALKVVSGRFNLVYPNCNCEGVNPSLPEFMLFKEKLVEYVQFTPSERITNVWTAANDIVTMCIFPHVSCVGTVINEMEHAKKINPNISVDEAALLATYVYVFDYVMDQISVLPVDVTTRL